MFTLRLPDLKMNNFKAGASRHEVVYTAVRC